MQGRSYNRLTREVIAEAALRIIDETGLPGLSMRSLGAALHVEGMALYRYFPQKEAILDQVVEMVLEGAVLPSTGQGWQSDLRTAALDLRTRLLLHPNAVPLVASRWLRTPTLVGLVDAAIARLTRDSFSEDGARSVMRALMSFLLGNTWVTVEGYVGEIPDTGGLTRKSVPPIVTASADSREHVELVEFERGLDFLLQGVRAAISEVATRAGSQH